MGSVLLLHPGGGGHGGARVATARQPPSWGPSMESAYLFRHWVWGAPMWCLSTDIAKERRAPAILLQFRGAVRDFA
eukprot:5685510-Lingulodinium_polyedra.AAC.1